MSREAALIHLVTDLLSAKGFENITLSGRAGSRELGYDIKANYVVETIYGGSSSRRWIVEVKNVNKLNIATLQQLETLAREMSIEKALLVTTANLTSASQQYVEKLNQEFRNKLEIWDRDKLLSLLDGFPDLKAKYSALITTFPSSTSNNTQPPEYYELSRQLTNCPLGESGWKQFEDICLSILSKALCPPLKPPKIQAKTLNGLERRDALFSLRGVEGEWLKLRNEFKANFLLCEFKNHSKRFSKDEVNQVRNYLRKTIGRIGIIFSRKGEDDGAKTMRNSIYSQDRKVILFFDESQLLELLRLKLANQNPLELIEDSIEDFYISHE